MTAKLAPPAILLCRSFTSQNGSDGEKSGCCANRANVLGGEVRACHMLGLQVIVAPWQMNIKPQRKLWGLVSNISILPPPINARSFRADRIGLRPGAPFANAEPSERAAIRLSLLEEPDSWNIIFELFKRLSTEELEGTGSEPA
ncbi:hypothetical protein B0T10DRAFT_465651 [Thelonectria olida]|uniref:Uncharacterized protein n=1 Tax=Thelonectria olida TaxID=1576542 RepID=A0A9P9AJJ1_9HYPO|nr:hypothetical protein B0T10DRAFT_465651 [Thelonectria olida]